MMNIFLVVLCIMVGLPVLVLAVNLANSSDGDTSPVLRLSFIVIGTGAAAVVFGPAFGKHPTWADFFLLAGILTNYLLKNHIAWRAWITRKTHHG